MVTPENVREWSMSFDDVTEEPHFERTSFRVKKKIFATMGKSGEEACLMLTPVDQSVFVDSGKGNIFPVANSWGKKGATIFNLKHVSKSIFKDALKCAYNSKKN